MPIIGDASEANMMEIEFPSASQTAFYPLFNYIQRYYWPKWTDNERQEFLRISGKIVFGQAVSTLRDFLQKPSACDITAKPYTIVSVSTSIATWGIAKIRELPDVEQFLLKHRTRLSDFRQDSPSDGRRPWQRTEYGSDTVTGGRRVTPDSNVERRQFAPSSGRAYTYLQTFCDILTQTIAELSGKKRAHDGSAEMPTKTARHSEASPATKPMNKRTAFRTGYGKFGLTAANRRQRVPRVNYAEDDEYTRMLSSLERDHDSNS